MPIIGFPIGAPLDGLPPPPLTPAQIEVFGVDLLFNGDLVVTPKGDYAEVAGEENLRRAIIRRLITRPGEYRRNPSYGCGLLSYVKKKMTQSALAELEQRIRDNLSRERRLDKIISLTLVPTTYDGNQPALQVSITVQSKGRTVQFRPMTFTRQL
jgi:phage baseplate assembly protein W